MTASKWRRSAITALALASLAFASACGGTTGDNKAKQQPSSGAAAAKPLVYGAFATPIEEPWDGVIHAALQRAADAGEITYKHVDNIGYSGGMERSLRNIA